MTEYFYIVFQFPVQHEHSEDIKGKAVGVNYDLSKLIRPAYFSAKESRHL